MPTPNLLKLLPLLTPSPTIVSKVTTSAEAVIAQINNKDTVETVRATILDIVERIEVHTDKLVLTIRCQPLLSETKKEGVIKLEYTLQQKRRGIESKLVIGGQVLGEPDKELILIIAKARSWYDGLKTGAHKSINDIAALENMDKGDVSRALPLAFLAPSIISDIISGQQPVDMTKDSLRRKTAHLPTNWSEQRQFLGFGA